MGMLVPFFLSREDVLPKAAGLQPKHWKALELIEESTLSLKEIATAIGMSKDSFYDLYEGNQNKMGETAALFKSELNKITARNSAKTKEVSKDNKKIAMYLMNDRLKALRVLEKSNSLNEKDKQEITRIMNTLNKSTPAMEIGSLSIQRGLTKEELRSEFQRLGAVARHALVAKRVQRFDAGRPGDIPGSLE